MAETNTDGSQSSSFQVEDDQSFIASLDEGGMNESEQPTEPEEDQKDNDQEEEDSGSSNADRPEWLPENFKTPEDLAKSYKSLQSEFTKVKQEIAKQKYSQKSQEELGGEPNKRVDGKASKKDEGNAAANQLEFDSAFHEFFETGELSDATVSKYAAKGIPANQLEAIMEGKQAQLKQLENSIYDTVGGKENYTEMLGWAQENLDPSDIHVFNDAIKAGPAYAKFAVQALKALQAQGSSRDPDLISPNSTVKGTNSKAGFSSTADMLKAMNDPRYERDSAYRAKVEERIANSNMDWDY